MKSSKYIQKKEEDIINCELQYSNHSVHYTKNFLEYKIENNQQNRIKTSKNESHRNTLSTDNTQNLDHKVNNILAQVPKLKLKTKNDNKLINGINRNKGNTARIGNNSKKTSDITKKQSKDRKGKNKHVKIEDEDVDFSDFKLKKSRDIKSISSPNILTQPLLGLKNQGNTCYINSTIQILIGLPKIYTKLTNSNYKYKTSIKTCEILKCFINIAKEIKDKNILQLNKEIHNMKRLMENRKQSFKGNNMEDATEFLSELMNAISEDFDKLEEQNLVKEYFLSSIQQILTCKGCNYMSSKVSDELGIWCELTSIESNKSIMTIQKLLDKRFTDEERDFKCNVCKVSKANVQTKFVKLPKVLHIYLKRFTYHHSKQIKIQTYVRIPNTINLSDYISETYHPTESTSKQFNFRKSFGSDYKV